MVQALIAAGADVNARGQGNATALIWAVIKGTSEIAQALIAADADVDAKEENSPALSLARTHGSLQLIELLEQAEARAAKSKD